MSPQPAYLMIDEIFAFAIPVHAPRDLATSVGVRGQAAPRELSKVRVTSAIPQAPSRRRAIENDIRHLAAAQAFGICSPSTQRTASTILLLPLPLGPTTAVIPRGKIELSLVGETLEADQLQTFEHAAPVGIRSSLSSIILAMAANSDPRGIIPGYGQTFPS